MPTRNHLFCRDFCEDNGETENYGKPGPGGILFHVSAVVKQQSALCHFSVPLSRTGPYHESANQEIRRFRPRCLSRARRSRHLAGATSAGIIPRRHLGAPPARLRRSVQATFRSASACTPGRAVAPRQRCRGGGPWIPGHDGGGAEAATPRRPPAVRPRRP